MIREGAKETPLIALPIKTNVSIPQNTMEACVDLYLLQCGGHLFIVFCMR